MSSSKVRRNKIVKPIVKYLNSTKIQNKSLVSWIRVIHFGSPIMTIWSLLYMSKRSSIIIIILNFIPLFLYIYLGGCFLSKIEKDLIGDDTNITDLFLELAGYKATSRNRKHSTIVIGSIYAFLVFIIFFYRFYS